MPVLFVWNQCLENWISRWVLMGKLGVSNGNWWKLLWYLFGSVAGHVIWVQGSGYSDGGWNASLWLLAWLVIDFREHVIRVQGMVWWWWICGGSRVQGWGFPCGWRIGYIRVGVFWLLSLIPFIVMSLSNQHPYSLFISGGLQSPSLAKAWVEVGDNDNTYLASADIVPFRLN